jgi:hypothetical protein
MIVVNAYCTSHTWHAAMAARTQICRIECWQKLKVGGDFVQLSPTFFCCSILCCVSRGTTDNRRCGRLEKNYLKKIIKNRPNYIIGIKYQRLSLALLCRITMNTDLELKNTYSLIYKFYNKLTCLKTCLPARYRDKYSMHLGQKVNPIPGFFLK